VDLQSDQWGVLTRMIRRTFKNLQREEGWVVVTAVIVMSLMMGIGLATYATVDTQQGQSRIERERDSSFNLAESAFYAETFVLGRDWPTAANPYSSTACTHNTSAPTRGCPMAADLRRALDTQALPDLSTGAEWTISVHDNGSPATGNDYDSSTDSQPAWDANNDGKLWVRADGVAKGRSRSIVGLLELETLGESVAQNVITAGHFNTSNDGNKVIVDTQGASATGSQVVVRCQPPPPPASPTDNTCIDYESAKGQVSPDRVYSDPSTQNSMTPEQVARFKTQAVANGTYFTSCPQSLTGQVVFVETTSTINCKYNEGDFNTPTSPGIVIFTNGILELGGGKVTYNGLVYMLNPPDGSNPMTRLIMHANGTLRGGVSVDGNGGVDAGSDKFNIIFDGAAFAQLQTRGTAGLVQNSWRELTPGT
jgi:Tfp pilus assembly protein PilX